MVSFAEGKYHFYSCLMLSFLFVCFRHGYGDYAAQAAAAAAVSSAASVDPYSVDGRFVFLFCSIKILVATVTYYAYAKSSTIYFLVAILCFHGCFQPLSVAFHFRLLLLIFIVCVSNTITLYHFRISQLFYSSTSQTEAKKEIPTSLSIA